MFDVSSLWGGTSAASAAKMAEPDEKDAKAQADKTSEAQAHAAAQGKAAADAAAELDASSASTSASGKPRPKGRPQGMKRMPSERPKFGMGRNEFEWVGRAEKRMRALNPGCSVDHFLPAEGLNA